MGTDLIILGLRLVFVLLIYAFVAQVVLVIVRDLRRAPAAEKQPKNDVAYLIVIDSGAETPIPGQRFGLEPITSIGRAPSSTICIPDTFASAEHALLALLDGQWWIEDLGSTNGTTLNRHPVTSSTRVDTGDVIEIGRTRMKMVKAGGSNG